jgi:uncharacterized membrane protein
MNERIKSINWLRILYFLPLTLFGVMHFAMPKYFEFLVPSFVYGGIFWVYFSGFALTAAGIAIMANILPKIAAICLIIFVLTFIVTVDIPEFIFGDDRNRFFISFLKDISLFSGTVQFLRSF